MLKYFRCFVRSLFRMPCRPDPSEDDRPSRLDVRIHFQRSRVGEQSVAEMHLSNHLTMLTFVNGLLTVTMTLLALIQCGKKKPASTAAPVSAPDPKKDDVKPKSELKPPDAAAKKLDGKKDGDKKDEAKKDDDKKDDKKEEKSKKNEGTPDEKSAQDGGDNYEDVNVGESPPAPK
ncbi:hypothetical protein L596_008975 [Steinernema carpocapsae]|uniref:Uncharacterized protein n=1 Tax=Steinernema carpocapsae TaxID=34508 RepID=A0A4U5PE95_STECR|nr:hypothetical protein L596_008975 [Steinernema carpocapsae]